MTIKKKILIGYGVAFVLMGMVFGWAVKNLVSLSRASRAILQENYRSILAAENMVNAIERQDSGILMLVLGKGEEGAAQFKENDAAFLQWLTRAKDNITINGEAEIVQSIEADYKMYRLRFYDLSVHSDLNTFPSISHTLYKESLFPIFLKIRQACIELRNLNEKTMYAANSRAGAVANQAIWSTVLVATTALIIALIFSIVLANRIVRPLRKFVDASRELSSGDYSIQVPVESRDEFGRLAGEFNRMAAKLGHYHELNIDQIISEKNKGEAILSSIEDGLVVFDKNLKVTGINPAARRMLNLEFTEAETLQCSDIHLLTDVCITIRKIVDSDIRLKIPDEQRIVTLTEGERTRHYLFSATAIKGKDGSKSGIVLLLRDVTRLKDVERMKSEFIMAASHELRTPLTSIGMSIDLLMEHTSQKLEEKDQELLQAAHEEVLRMKALVNDLLDLSRIEAGQIALEFSNVSIKTLFDHVQKVFKGQLENKKVELSVEFTDDPPTVCADANKITWVVTNLVSNALRYVNEGGNIRLIASRIASYVHLSVQDDGPGIPKEYQSKLFQKFVQVKGREGGGTGLGLAICKEIVRAHGGTIWVESSPGQGSTFIFTLPVAN
jgi:NtrC-family two-component system sensor histidine kinase KinB